MFSAPVAHTAIIDNGEGHEGGSFGGADTGTETWVVMGSCQYNSEQNTVQVENKKVGYFRPAAQHMHQRQESSVG